MSSICSKPLVRGQCGMKGHNSKECEKDAKCPNCGGDILALSFNCTRYNKENAILSIMTRDVVSFSDLSTQY